jgi:HK97 family phage major capsid protein
METAGKQSRKEKTLTEGSDMSEEKNLKTLEELSEKLLPRVDELSAEAKEAIKTAEANAAALNDLAKANAALESEVGIQGARVSELKDFLMHTNGKSGEQDFNNLFVKWMTGCWEQAKFGMVSEQNQIEGYEYEQKALDSTTTTAAGFLVPEVMAATLYAAKDIYGTLSPLMAKMTLAAGQTALINRENAKPVAAYRVLGQNNPIPTTDPTYDQDTVNPMLIGCLITVSNELLGAPGVNYTATIAPAMLRAIVLAVLKRQVLTLVSLSWVGMISQTGWHSLLKQLQGISICTVPLRQLL